MNYLIKGTAIAGSLLVSFAAFADVSNWFDDFEGYNNTDSTTLEPFYNVFANVDLGPTGTVDYGYGAVAPNNWDPGVTTPAAFSALTPGEGALGDVALSVYSDYANGDQANGTIEANFLKEYTIGAVDVGKTWKFTFEHKRGLLVPPTTAAAFIKVLCSVDGTACGTPADYSVLGIATVDMTGTPATWGGTTLTLAIDPAWVGMLFQIGMSSTATNYNGSSIFYDNICLYTEASCPGAVGGGITAWTDDFEGYNNTDSTTLEPFYNVFANVDLGPTGTVDYGYGAVAPNNWDPGVTTPAAFSALTPGEGATGDVALSVYSDYANGDQLNGTIEANFLKEYTVSAANVGETWTYAFDAKLGLLVSPTTASAFIKVLCSVDGTACGTPADYSVLGIATVDMTSTPATWNGYTLSLPITAAMDGMLFQIGMNSTATNYDPSSIFYDNLCLASDGSCGAAIDTDGDGVDDSIDNCTLVANPGQQDGDGDGFGNRCDADFDNSCLVNAFDLGAFKAAFFTANAEVDLDSSGLVNAFDLGIFKSLFFTQPGPSALATCP